MCSPNKCSRCGLASFVGCGNHLDALFKNLKTSQLCHCHSKIVEWIKKNKK